MIDKARISWCPLLLLVAALGMMNTATAQAPLKTMVQDVALEQKLGAQLPLDVEVIDDQGRTVSLRSAFRGRPVILNFVQYRCPMLCTQVMNGLLRSSQAVPFVMGKDYDVVTISIDPLETPELAAEKKRTYVSRYRRPGAEQGWHFFIADLKTIQKLTSAVGFKYRHDPITNQYAHASGIIVMTPDGRASRYFYGIDYVPTDLRLGLVEASENRIGGLVEQFLLLCYHYNPATGRYGLVIEGAIKIAGIATVLLLGGYLLRMYRLERGRSTVTGGPAPHELQPTAEAHP